MELKDKIPEALFWRVGVRRASARSRRNGLYCAYAPPMCKSAALASLLLLSGRSAAAEPMGRLDFNMVIPSLAFHDASLSEVLAALSNESTIPIVARTPPGNVTVDFEISDMPSWQALDSVAELYKMRWWPDSGVVILRPVDAQDRDYLSGRRAQAAVTFLASLDGEQRLVMASGNLIPLAGLRVMQRELLYLARDGNDLSCTDRQSWDRWYGNPSDGSISGVTVIWDPYIEVFSQDAGVSARYYLDSRDTVYPYLRLSAEGAGLKASRSAPLRVWPLASDHAEPAAVQGKRINMVSGEFGLADFVESVLGDGAGPLVFPPANVVRVSVGGGSVTPVSAVNACAAACGASLSLRGGHVVLGVGASDEPSALDRSSFRQSSSPVDHMRQAMLKQCEDLRPFDSWEGTRAFPLELFATRAELPFTDLTAEQQRSMVALIERNVDGPQRDPYYRAGIVGTGPLLPTDAHLSSAREAPEDLSVRFGQGFALLTVAARSEGVTWVVNRAECIQFCRDDSLVPRWSDERLSGNNE